jgi:hypothetical protein
MNIFEQLSKFSEAMVELPFAAARSMLVPEREGGEQTLQQAGWKAYDAWVQLMNESANSFYQSPEIGASVGRSMETSLQWQRLGTAVTDAFFAALWPAVGLPSSAELTELRAEVGALREELATARLENEEARAAEFALNERQTSEALAGMWNGGWTASPFAPERGEDEPAN